MRKLFFSVAAAAIAISPLSGPVVLANLDTVPTYDNLTEKASFYRVTRGFVSPLHELDNNVDTKISFAKGKYLTYMDYIFVDDIYVNSIKFVSTDSSQYQRVLLMENGTIRQQYDLSNYPSGVIPVNFSSQTIDTVKLQFNGVEGYQHTLAELEIVGKKATTVGGKAPSGESTLVTPTIIEQLLEEQKPTEPGTGGGGVPTEPTQPPVDEDDSDTGTGSGEPSTPVIPPVDEDDDNTPGTGGGTPSDPQPPVVDEDNEGGVGTGGGESTPPGEEDDTDNDGIGDEDYIENGEIPEVTPPVVPGDGGGVIVAPVEPEVPGSGGVIVVPEEPTVPGDEQPEVPAEPEVPVVEPPVVVDPPVVVAPPVVPPVVIVPPVVPTTPELPSEICAAHPLTPSVFKNKHDYKYYSVNAASWKLLSHQHYNESYVLNKLQNSKIVINGKVYTAKEFFSFLKADKFPGDKNKPDSKENCDPVKETPVKVDDKKNCVDLLKGLLSKYVPILVKEIEKAKEVAVPAAKPVVVDVKKDCDYKADALAKYVPVVDKKDDKKEDKNDKKEDKKDDKKDNKNNGKK